MSHRHTFKGCYGALALATASALAMGACHRSPSVEQSAHAAEPLPSAKPVERGAVRIARVW
jgi:hypothetical protein